MQRSSARCLNYVTACEVEAREVQWLWPDWIPLGKLTVLEGDPGLGKCTLLCDLDARQLKWPWASQQAGLSKTAMD